MSMKVDMLVALLAIHLTTAVSTDCDSQLNECVDEVLTNCVWGAWDCSRNQLVCFRLRDLCEAAEIESARSETESSSGASEVERSANSSENTADCGSRLRQCIKNTGKNCGQMKRPCLLTVAHCYRSRDLCEVAEIESARSETESSSGASEVERSANTSESTADCDSVLRRCLKNRWNDCEYRMRPCIVTVSHCYSAYDLCEAAETESAQSEVESSSSASEIERKPGGSENNTESAHWEVESSSSASEIERKPGGSENNMESAQSEVESSLSAFEIERKPGGSKSPTDCDSELARCVDNTWRTCSFFHFLIQCLLTEQRCYNSRDLCKPAEIGSDESLVGSSLSASEIERKPGDSENPTECDSQLTQCLENTWEGCGYSMRSCVVIIQRCYHLRDLCEVESAHWVVKSSSSASEIEREPSGSQYCDSVLRRCLKNRGNDCEYKMRPCIITASHCYSAYDLCEAAETESAHWEVESSLSASEIERKPGGSENNTEIAQSKVGSSLSASEIERKASGSENLTGNT